MVINSCSKDSYLFDDELWKDNSGLSRPRMTKSNPEPGSGQQYFPPVDIIVNNSAVKDSMDEAWSLMLASCSEAGRREYGFLIFYNPTTGTLSTGQMCKGDLLSYDKRGSVRITGSCPSGTYPCAKFHVHTSFYSAPEGKRRHTGLSDGDTSSVIPTIIYDYVDPYTYKGHPMNSSKTVYSYYP